MDSEKRNRINQLLNYPEDSAGSVMTTEYVDLRKHTTVREALAHIKQTGIHKGNDLHLLYSGKPPSARNRHRQRSDDHG